MSLLRRARGGLRSGKVGMLVQMLSGRYTLILIIGRKRRLGMVRRNRLRLVLGLVRGVLDMRRRIRRLRGQGSLRLLRGSRQSRLGCLGRMRVALGRC